MLPVKGLVTMISQVIPVQAPPYAPPHRARTFEIVSSRGQINERNVLLVSRPGAGDSGERVLFVSSIPGFIGPRELPKLLQELVNHMKEEPEVPVVIDCPEYLALHNGFTAFLKFLNTLRDYAILYGGKVYLITEPSAWSEREYAMLRGLIV